MSLWKIARLPRLCHEAYRGNLKITKDSSDGRKDGFAFEVKSEDGTYCETFTSPENGIILIEGCAWQIHCDRGEK